MYLSGRVVPRDCGHALALLRDAASHGNSRAQSKLGGMYATGGCVPLDRAIAYKYFSQAHTAEPHNIWLERSMAILWRDMSEAERARTGR